jgi:PPOX class probable F420-dependent enzyme
MNTDSLKKKREAIMVFQLPDPTTPFGERVARRLHDEPLIWLTTVDGKGMPQPTPVWFLWDAATATFLVYSQTDAKRLAHIQQNPKVALNFDGDGSGGDIIVFTGTAQISSADPSADQLPTYVEKYGALIARLFTIPENFASMYSVALRIHPSAVRGH